MRFIRALLICANMHFSLVWTNNAISSYRSILLFFFIWIIFMTHLGDVIQMMSLKWVIYIYRILSGSFPNRSSKLCKIIYKMTSSSVTLLPLWRHHSSEFGFYGMLWLCFDLCILPRVQKSRNWRFSHFIIFREIEVE